MQRIILHVDLDYFYAQCEVLRKPELAGKPVVICVYSGRNANSGAVGTASYEARALGIKSGIPIARAKQLMNKETVLLPVDMEYYKEVSARVMEILEGFSDKFEQVSVDEAYLDVSSCGVFEKAVEIATKLKREVKEKEGLTCSVGVGPNKLIAKMAAGEKKPDGLFCVRPEEVRDYLREKPVKELFLVGPKTEQVLVRAEVKSIGELAGKRVEEVVELLGENKGRLLWGFANGADERPVEQGDRQQLSKLGTLPENTRDLGKVGEFLDGLCTELAKRIEKAGVEFRNVSFIGISTELAMYTRSKTLDGSSSDVGVARKVVKELAGEFLKESNVVLRRAGVRVAGLERGENEKREKKQKTLGEF